MEQICNRCTRLLAEGQKERTGCCENGAAQGTCHHIPGKASKHSNRFLRWLSTCRLGRALSPALTLCRTQTLPSPACVLTRYYCTTGYCSFRFQNDFGLVSPGANIGLLDDKPAHFCGQSFPDRARCAGDRQSSAISLEIFSIIPMAKIEILTKSSNKKRKICTLCSCSEQNPLQLFLKRFLFKPSDSFVLASLGCCSHSHRTNKETSFQKEATNCPQSKLLPGW